MKAIVLGWIWFSTQWLGGLTADDPAALLARAAADKQFCRTSITRFETAPRSHVNLAYLGAMQAIWAKHLFNPLSKLSTFRKGKENLERAARADPHNIEIISLRYSVQKNAPRFLGYHANLAADSLFLRRNAANIKPEPLKDFVSALLND